MPKLTWSEPENRIYETGVDRGVLYPVVGVGVPWNGLIAVTEAHTGGEANPFYMDGVRHLDRRELEEFGATLEAFTYPPEFEECDGSLELIEGLSARHQRRKPFSLCYRTRIGSALDANAGYKLHLIYNATASPSEASYQTMGDDPTLVTFSWDLSAIPEKLTGIRPTAYFEVDSTKTEPTTLEALETVLYGSDTTSPSMPTPEQLVEIFTSGLPVSPFTVTDNGDGTFTVVGADDEVTSPDANGVFTLASGFVIDNGDGTYTATSS